MEWLKYVDYWHWWVLAGALLILEMSAPTYFFLWLGIAAAAVGFLVLGFPDMPFEIQFVAYGVLCIVAAIAWYRFRENPNPESSVETSISDSGEQGKG